MVRETLASLCYCVLVAEKGERRDATVAATCRINDDVGKRAARAASQHEQGHRVRVGEL